MSKADKSIVKGLEAGGAKDVKFYGDGKHRNAEMTVGGERKIIFKMPTSSHLDDAALFRKGRDLVKRFGKYNVDTLPW